MGILGKISCGFSLLIALSATACYHTHEEPPSSGEAKKNLDKIEAYYYNQAKQNAAFRSGCDPAKIQAETLGSRPRYLSLKEGDVYKVPIIESIGVRACEHRFVYTVYCNEDQSYAAPWWKDNENLSCNVLFEGANEAAKVMKEDQKKRDEERKQRDEEERKKRDEEERKKRQQK